MTTATCSRGWGGRCARAKGPKCRCACGGENHGNPAARRGKDQLEMKLTDRRVFEARHLCTKCGLDLNHYDEHTPRTDCTHDDFQPEDTRRFLPLAETVQDIHLGRTPVGGMRNADGSHLGDALVNIDRRFVVHSPDGFEWGYGGSGPSDLALNVLALFVPPPEAWRLHPRYKNAVIARIPREGGTITADSVRGWIADRWKEEASIC